MSLSANHKKYLSNTSWLFLEKILRMVVGFSVGVWTARYLGPEQFGLFSYAQSFVFLFTAFATLGLDGIVIRELVKDPSRRDSLLGTSFVLKLIGSIAVMILLTLSVTLMHTDTSTAVIMILVASATVFQSFNVIDFYFQSKVLSKYVVFSSIISMLIVNTIKIWLIVSKVELIWFAAVIAVEAAIISAGLIGYYLKSGMKLKLWKFETLVAKGLLRDSWPLILGGILLSIQARIDQVMLKQMISIEEVGYYSSAMRLIEVFAFIPMILQSTMNPILVTAHTDSYKYNRLLLDNYRLSFLLFLIVAVPIFFFASHMVILLYGAEYAPAGILLSLLAIRLFFANMGVARGSYLIVENYQGYAFVSMCIGTISNVLFNYFFIPLYQSKGAIIASILSFMITIFVVDLMYRKTRQNALLMLKGIISFYRVSIKGRQNGNS